MVLGCRGSLGNPVLSVWQHRIKLEANTCWGLWVVVVKRPAALASAAEFTRILTHYEQESGEFTPASLLETQKKPGREAAELLKDALC